VAPNPVTPLRSTRSVASPAFDPLDDSQGYPDQTTTQVVGSFQVGGGLSDPDGAGPVVIDDLKGAGAQQVRVKPGCRSDLVSQEGDDVIEIQEQVDRLEALGLSRKLERHRPSLAAIGAAAGFASGRCTLPVDRLDRVWFARRDVPWSTAPYAMM
jgi:hypothetical protein